MRRGGLNEQRKTTQDLGCMIGSGNCKFIWGSGWGLETNMDTCSDDYAETTVEMHAPSSNFPIKNWQVVF